MIITKILNFIKTEDYVYNPVSDNWDRKTEVQGNAEITLSYNAGGDLIKIEKTIGADTYTKTISNSDSVVSTTKVISTWS